MEKAPLSRIGPFALAKLPDGSVSAHHDRMREPLVISEAQFVRWLMGMMRRELVIPPTT